jgi:hypothetical protein
MQLIKFARRRHSIAGRRFLKVLCLICLTVSGCTLAAVDVTVVSERTALENQVLGTYQTLDDATLLTASVRAMDASGNVIEAPAHSGDYQDTLAAMQVVSFHADDIAAFKQLGWVGEDNQGLLHAFALKADRAPESLRDFAARYAPAEFDAVLQQVNQARETIMWRVIGLNENLTEADWPQVKQAFGRLNRENALAGESIQLPDGSWEIKK